jgi:hypothetical protein
VSAVSVAEWVLSGGVIGGIGTVAVKSLWDSEQRAQLRALAWLRVRRAEQAALEASVDDPEYSPEIIRAEVTRMIAAIDEIWRTGAVEGRRDGPLLKAWATSREQSLRCALRVAGRSRIDILRVINRESDAEDRVIVRVRVHVRRDRRRRLEPGETPGVPAIGGLTLDERWTLSQRSGEWYLSSVAGDPLAGPVLSAPLITSPVHDDQRLREASLRELAERHEEPRYSAAELVDRDAPAALALLDLSLADDRFSPMLLGATVAHIVEAWEEASDDPRPLESVTSEHGINQLLHPHDPESTTLIRDATVKHWSVLELYPDHVPPAVLVRVSLRAARYRVADGRSFGDDRKRRDCEVDWELELEGGKQPRWRLIGARDQRR